MLKVVEVLRPREDWQLSWPILVFLTPKASERITRFRFRVSEDNQVFSEDFRAAVSERCVLRQMDEQE
jgi:hypothetical protein